MRERLDSFQGPPIGPVGYQVSKAVSQELLGTVTPKQLAEAMAPHLGGWHVSGLVFWKPTTEEEAGGVIPYLVIVGGVGGGVPEREVRATISEATFQALASLHAGEKPE